MHLLRNAMSDYERRGITAQPIFPDRREFTSEVMNSFGPGPVGPHDARNTALAILSGAVLGRALSRRGRGA
jgi:hypothetical protein